MHHNSKQLQQLQADLAAAMLRYATVNHRHPTFSIWTHHIANRFLSLSRSSPSSYKRFPSPNNASTSLPKIAKPKRDKSQPSLTAIARQFSSPSKPTSFKLIHVPIRHCLSLQQLRSSVCRLHVNTRRILDIHYSDRNLVSFLTHIGYETEIRLQLSKFNITVRCNFDPLDPSIIRDPTLINEPIDRRLQHAR
ncbi:hypothetical protein G6F46_008151 [Rhizopus delemar]|uniref:Uncharacterized protein n=2 Tax=Rhizopus TaxID=4842 RepID=A0A9P6Z046_9FUNG|nr:hypothetical protein G6F55_007084 [Rhizopus delemar]KAG1550480.1 hypothetical protein G6F51_002426 [Rhizopus arrhizus]KAG1505173.1 hypothetical protein G6F54_000505 [Rhizopus delemar]KAG1508839.1 hypothetical protein G6F53_007887 [Rhizopus delemar]KAG1514651.1 hypothetical protein G6F52_009870 [Rhizopus delemar]